MSFAPCTINGDSCEIDNSPTTFSRALSGVTSVDTIQFHSLAPSEPNCSILMNNFILINTCIYQYRPVR